MRTIKFLKQTILLQILNNIYKSIILLYIGEYFFKTILPSDIYDLATTGCIVFTLVKLMLHLSDIFLDIFLDGRCKKRYGFFITLNAVYLITPNIHQAETTPLMQQNASLTITIILVGILFIVFLKKAELKRQTELARYLFNHIEDSDLEIIEYTKDNHTHEEIILCGIPNNFYRYFKNDFQIKRKFK